ncbi:MAG: PilZ domain-containing protein [Acidobacteria bacterium]|nr:PilZ domain-containing protein [Acidobacteriota bacterium]
MQTAIANYPALETIKTSQWKTSSMDIFDRRTDKRISLSLKMYVRRTINNITYFRSVETTDVSWNGARIICDVPLEQGAELVFSGLNGKFSAVAQVRHVVACKEGGWAIGLEFVRKTGKWVVIK